AALYRRSAELGDAHAQYCLGTFYLSERVIAVGLTRDYQQAFRLFQLSADQGYSSAMRDIGLMYEKGQVPGSPASIQQAGKWFLMAAANGLEDAIWNLEDSGMRFEVLETKAREVTALTLCHNHKADVSRDRFHRFCGRCFLLCALPSRLAI